MKSLPYSVLVIDDSVQMRLAIPRMLKRMGFSNIAVAENGVVGLEKMKETQPDIVILDVVMPEMDGLSTLREIRKIAKKVLVVVASSLSDREKVIQFKEAGANYFILKTVLFEGTNFQDVIGRVLASLEQEVKGDESKLPSL